MKYIIEADERSELVQVISVMPNGTVYTNERSIDELEELTSGYINEHYGDLQDEAYQRGLDDAWETARKVALNSNDGGLCIEKLDEIFDCYTLQQVFKRYTAQQTIAKLKVYEEKQTDDEIKVGDEVYAYTPSGKTQPFIIIKIYDEDGVKYYSGINADGNHVQGGLNYIKTGRKFPHVAELLKAMKE